MLPALESGKVAVYVTDFPNDKTAGAPGVIAIPHLGASTPESEDNCARMAAQEIVEYVENGNIINSVNMPRAVMDRSPIASTRLCILHKNIPDMIAQISRAVSSVGMNIENMVNGSRGDYAYTMCDLCGETEGIASAIEKVSGVIRVRVIKF
jgi:D-3-phosphoglycerate dehydrogenase